jgi:uncharacterized protein YeaO (DUF488 family)
MSETYRTDIRIKRIYEVAAKDDGFRLLVDLDHRKNQ